MNRQCIPNLGNISSQTLTLKNLVRNKEEDVLQSDYQSRFKFITDINSDLEERNVIEERLPPLSNPVPKLSFEKDTINKLPTQKPAIPLLNIGTKDTQEKEINLEKPKVPEIKGIALDLGQVSREPLMNEYDTSSDRIYEESGEYSSSRASNNPGKSISLDLTKAKEIQNQILGQGPNGENKIPWLDLSKNVISDMKIPSLGIPKSSESRNHEEETSHRADIEQSSGLQLKINIKNVAKLSEDTEIKKEENDHEPPKHKRGSYEPEPPLSNASSSDNDFFMSKNTSVTEERNGKFRLICSEIIEDFLYLGSDYLAKNKSILQDNKITHIINSAGDYSPNYHDNDFKYLTFHLKDHPRENIECIFYNAINFIEDAKASKGRVYVHCVQGISRSATICLAYVILSKGLDYNEAFEFIQKKREVINPNLGFIVQLMWFHKRLYKSFDSIPVNPRVYIICSHEKEDPLQIVAKLNMEQFFVDKHCKPMDPRAVNIVQTKEEFIVLIGGMWQGKNREVYLDYAYKYIAELQKREKGAQSVTEVEQDQVDNYFWSIWGLEDVPNNPFLPTTAWDYWFPNLENSDKISNIPMVHQIDTYNEEVKAEKKLKPRLFTYPDTDISSAVFDEEDLDFDELNVVWERAKNEEDVNTIYVYEGDSFEVRTNLSKEDYIDKVVQKFFEGISKEQIVVKNCELGEESPDDFFTLKTMI